MEFTGLKRRNLGGMKDSRWGKNGMEAVEEFTELSWITLQMKIPRRP
jgi:hypothetical protein